MDPINFLWRAGDQAVSSEDSVTMWPIAHLSCFQRTYFSAPFSCSTRWIWEFDSRTGKRHGGTATCEHLPTAPPTPQTIQRFDLLWLHPDSQINAGLFIQSISSALIQSKNQNWCVDCNPETINSDMAVLPRFALILSNSFLHILQLPRPPSPCHSYAPVKDLHSVSSAMQDSPPSQSGGIEVRARAAWSCQTEWI